MSVERRIHSDINSIIYSYNKGVRFMSDSNTKKKAMDMINGSLWIKILIFALH